MKDPIRVKAGKKSKRKGSKFQRDIAKVLGLWWCNDEKAFHSTPASGGLRWKTQVAQTAGDIVATVDFPWIVECKNREKWRIEELLHGGSMFDFWAQVNEDVKRLHIETGILKEPMLVVKRNRQVPLVFIRVEDSFFKGFELDPRIIIQMEEENLNAFFITDITYEVKYPKDTLKENFSYNLFLRSLTHNA